MTERFHTPPHYNAIQEDAPLIFLAGPIQGAPDWQTSTADELLHHLPDSNVASPRRVADIDSPRFDYKEQVTWEKYHLRRSRALGVIAFWFAAQDPTIPYETGRAYAQTSRIEIGRLFGWADHEPFPLVIGFDKDYTVQGGGSERYVRTMADEHDIPVLDTLDEVIDQTIFLTPRR